MNETKTKTGFKLVGVIVWTTLGLAFIYNLGREQGVSVSENFVAKYEPEAYRRLCEVLNR